jgi:hypothetical protein
MVFPFHIKLTDDTNEMDLDRHFMHAWVLTARENKLQMILDATECNRVSLKRVMRSRSVLNKHRDMSNKHIDHSIILVKSKFTKKIIQLGLFFMKTERPVYVKVL